jgi:hypothetical protein
MYIKEIITEIIATNEKNHKKYCGILIKDSKNIPTTNEIQRNNSTFDALI